jgi:hypothetical protein
MKIFISSILFLFITNVSKAQFLQDIQGRVITEQSFTDVIGSPFFNNVFVNGNVVLTNGDKFKDVPLKYSSYKDELFFKNPKDGSLLSFVVPVKSFELLGETYINGLPAVDNFTENSYYVLIADAKVKLFVKNYKTILENKPYNSASIEKKFEDNKTYYVLKDGKMSRFKPSKKDLLETFGDKSAEIDSFLKKEKIDYKNNADLVKVFQHYSTL